MSTSDPSGPYATDPGVPTSPSLGRLRAQSAKAWGCRTSSLLTRLANEIFSSAPVNLFFPQDASNFTVHHRFFSSWAGFPA